MNDLYEDRTLLDFGPPLVTDGAMKLVPTEDSGGDVTLPFERRRRRASDLNVVINLGSEYTPTPSVVDMHNAPRFGHSNHIGKLASRNPADAYDYEEGIKQFILFVSIPFVLWAAFLVFLKWRYGVDRIGCAAGGDVIDISKLRRQGMKRKQRQKRIFRSYRLQSVFLICSMLLGISSVFLSRLGLAQMELSWGEVSDINDSVEAVAFRALGVIAGLDTARVRMHTLSADFPFLNPKGGGGDVSWCPILDFRGAPKDADVDNIQQLDSSMIDMRRQMFEVLAVLDQHVPVEHGGLQKVVDSTKMIDGSVSWSYDNDWILKLVLMMFNVTNLLLFMTCFFLSKRNIVHKPSRFYATYILMPTFVGLSTAMLFALATIGVSAVMTGDFCAGGEGIGSPKGAIEDAILMHEFGSLDRNHSRSVYHDAFDYYAGECVSEWPLDFLDDFRLQVDGAAEYAGFLAANVGANDTSRINLLTSICGVEMSFLPGKLRELEQLLWTASGEITELQGITECRNISPIIRRITFGGLCEECISGMTWAWWILLVMCILSMIMVTTRAALYNSVVSRPKRHKPANLDKEMAEYRAFMLQYYEDARDWNLHLTKKIVDGDDCDDAHDIVPVATFETEGSDESDMDRKNEPNSESLVDVDEASQSSTESDFDDNDEDDEDLKSMISSLVSESASSFRRTMQQMKSISRSMLGNLKHDEDEEDIVNPVSPDTLVRENQFTTRRSPQQHYLISNGVDFYRTNGNRDEATLESKRKASRAHSIPRNRSISKQTQHHHSYTPSMPSEPPLKKMSSSSISKNDRRAKRSSKSDPSLPNNGRCELPKPPKSSLTPPLGIGPTIAVMRSRYSISASPVSISRGRSASRRTSEC